MMEIKEHIRGCEDLKSLSGAIAKLLNFIELDSLRDLPESERREVALVFREKMFHFISQGYLPNKMWLVVYALFKNQDFPIPDERISRLRNSFKPRIFDSKNSDNENVLLIELVFLSYILDGLCRQGLIFYIRKILQTPLSCIEAMGSAEFIVSFFCTLGVEFEEFATGLREFFRQDFPTLNFRQKRFALSWQFHVFWNVGHFYNHKSWLEFYPIWRDAFYEQLHLIKEDPIQAMDLVLYMQFFIYHLCGNNFSTQEEWRIFNTQISKKAAPFYEQFPALPSPLLWEEESLGDLSSCACNFLSTSPTKGKKKILGFLRDRLVKNSPYKVEYSFLKRLMGNEFFKQNYEVKIYLMSLIEKGFNDEEVVQSYRELGIEILDASLVETNSSQKNFYEDLMYGSSHLKKALFLIQKMSLHGVDILISPNNGYGISDFVLAQRVARKQIFWSHGNFVYDVDFLDARVTHICFNQESINHQGYEFLGIPIAMHPFFYNPKVVEDEVIRIKHKYPGGVVLGVIGRLVKMDSLEYLRAVTQIMHAILDAKQECIFLACGVGNVDEIKNKIQKIDANLLDRFYFPGFVDSGLYGHVIDLWLDTFPMQQGESRTEFSYKNKLWILLSHESREARFQRLYGYFSEHEDVFRKMAEKFGVDFKDLEDFYLKDESLVAFSQEDYIQKAISLAQDPCNQRIVYFNSILRLIHESIKNTQAEKNFFLILDLLK